jgi:hypothetical protein
MAHCTSNYWIRWNSPPLYMSLPLAMLKMVTNQNIQMEIMLNQWGNATHAPKTPKVFSFWGGRGRRRGWFGFLNCSQCVLIKFSKGSPSFWCVPNSYTLLMHMLCSKYIGGPKGRHSIFEIKLLFWGASKVSVKFIFLVRWVSKKWLHMHTHKIELGRHFAHIHM